MNLSGLKVIIAVVLVGFILFKSAVSFVCAPNQPNSVAEVISNVAPAPSTNPVAEKPDPLSWGPILNNLVKLIAKACPA